jgi:hypothetical protein
MKRTHLLRASGAILSAGMVLAVAGCSDSASGPDGSGDGFAQAMVNDDPNSTTPSSSAAPAFRIAGSSESAQYEGTISGNMSVAMSADGEVWYDLGTPNGIAVEAQSTGSGTNVHGEVRVPAGTYARVRLIMEDASATIDAGATIGGVQFDAEVDVLLGNGGEIVIEKEVSTFTVSAEASTRIEIAFDLNSEAWLTAQNVENESASGQEVQEASRARTRSRDRELQ